MKKPTECLQEIFLPVMQIRSVIVFAAVVVPAVLPAMRVFVIYAAVSAHLAVVPVGAAVTVPDTTKSLALVDSHWTGNIRRLY